MCFLLVELEDLPPAGSDVDNVDEWVRAKSKGGAGNAGVASK